MITVLFPSQGQQIELSVTCCKCQQSEYSEHACGDPESTRNLQAAPEPLPLIYKKAPSKLYQATIQLQPPRIGVAGVQQVQL